jgi:hypothetical protein
VDENDFPEPALRKVLDAIGSDAVTPQERYRFIQEAEWEKTKTEERQDGFEQGLRESIQSIAAAFGLQLTDTHRTQLATATQRAALGLKGWGEANPLASLGAPQDARAHAPAR